MPEGMGSNEQVALTLETLETDDGDRLTDEALAGFQQIEDHIQKFLAENGGKHHEKPYKLTVDVTVTAEGRFRRTVDWEVSVKLPKVSKKHTQSARSQDGMMVTDASLQMRLEGTDVRGARSDDSEQQQPGQ